MEEKININVPQFNNSNIFKIMGLAAFIFLAYNSFYTIDASANGVVLRFGKISAIQEPGLHFKIPFIDIVHVVEVTQIKKEEFGFQTIESDVKTRYSTDDFTDESWMLTGDLRIAEVRWAVQYKIKDATKYLFNVKNVEKIIRDESEATMQLMIGDRSFSEVLSEERRAIREEARSTMQANLDNYDCGIFIQLVQLQGVVPPGPVADSFNEVNRARQEKEAVINDATKKLKEITLKAGGTAKRMISEAEGYAVERINNANGDIAQFNKVLKEYNKAPEITRDRLYIEAMEDVLKGVKGKVIVDPDLENFLPLMKIESKDGN